MTRHKDFDTFFPLSFRVTTQVMTRLVWMQIEKGT
jgi:hypothetical protein